MAGEKEDQEERTDGERRQLEPKLATVFFSELGAITSLKIWLISVYLKGYVNTIAIHSTRWYQSM